MSKTNQDKPDILADLRGYVECASDDFQNSEWKRMDILRSRYPVLRGPQNGFWVGHDAERNTYILFFRVIPIHEIDATVKNVQGIHPLFEEQERLTYLLNHRYPIGD
jgi:hypothetical protein